MLVLSRKNAQAVIIGGPQAGNVLRVTVLGIKNGSVRLGFEASKDVSVHREEVWQRIGADRRTEAPWAAHDGVGSRGG